MIPLTEIQSYMELFGPHDVDHKADFAKILHEMDRAFLDHKHSKDDKEGNGEEYEQE